MTANPVDNGTIAHRGPVASVTVQAHMRSGPHGLMEYPLDLTVATELMFLFGEQARRGPDQEPLRITPQSVLEHLKSIGVRSGNGSRLIGRDAVYESFARLRSKGYIRRIIETDAASGQRTGVAYEFYDWPAWNPEAPALTESVQVGTTSGIAGSGNAGSRKPERANSRSVQVGTTSGIAGSGNAGSESKPQVESTSGIAGSPPHPPEEEVGTTSPSPHKPATASRRNKQQQPDVAPEAVAAAREFLMKLPGPWAAGAQRAANLAPWLVHNAELTGWSLDLALRLYLTRRESGKKPVENYGAMLAYRVKEMQSHEAVVEAAREAKEAEQQPQPTRPSADAKSGRLEWCGKCNNGEKPLEAFMRVIPSPDPADDTVTRCPDCHPAEVARRAACS